MTRNWGIPAKDGEFRRARNAKPLLSLGITAIYGVIAAALAALSFTEARSILSGLFRGWSLAPAIVAAGLGCWLYIYIAWPRFAAQFQGGDEFPDLLRFYARAAIALGVVLLVMKFLKIIVGPTVGGMLLCLSGGAAAAAAFQTVMLFVPPGSPGDSATKN
ncbi:MAG: hypothetical protein U5J99_04725 [Parvularculaceae bacterium]|nr:hypothetical protein [Parvularculaceae bacterium]